MNNEIGEECEYTTVKKDNIGFVADAMSSAAEAFNTIGFTFRHLHPTTKKPAGTKWTKVEIDMLKIALKDLNDAMDEIIKRMDERKQVLETIQDEEEKTKILNDLAEKMREQQSSTSSSSATGLDTLFENSTDFFDGLNLDDVLPIDQMLDAAFSSSFNSVHDDGSSADLDAATAAMFGQQSYQESSKFF